MRTAAGHHGRYDGARTGAGEPRRDDGRIAMVSKSRFIVSRMGPVALLLVAMASIQSGASVAKTMFPMTGAPGAVSLRLVFAAVLMLAVLRPWRRPAAGRDWKAITIYGIALGSMNFLFYQAIDNIPLGIAVAFEFTGPLTVALLASKRRLDLFWVALAIGGLAVLLWPNDNAFAAARDPYGVVCALGAGACWALYILFGQKAGAVHGMQGAALGVCVAALVIAPIGLIDAGPKLFSLQVLPLALVVAVMSTALPYTLEMVALPRLPTQTFGTLMSLEPAFGALSGLLFLDQHLDSLQWLAIGAVICASMGTTLTPAPADTAVESPVPD